MNRKHPDADIERLLQDEQGAVARLIDDAVTALGNPNKQPKDPDTANWTLRQRAKKLSLGARITARMLTKLRLDSRYPPGKQPLRVRKVARELLEPKLGRLYPPSNSLAKLRPKS